MLQKFSVKDLKRETSLIRSRIYIAGFFMLLLGSVVVARIFYLQVIMHDHFTTLSRHNRVKILPIPPTRGLIFSRDKVLLADNRPSFSLEVIPEQVDDLDQLIKRLGVIIKIEGSDIKRFKDQLRKKRRFENVPIRFNLSDEEVARISVNRHLLPGIDVVARLNRYYPLGPNTSHAIGYVGMIDEDEFRNLNASNYRGTSYIGKVGVEKAYEKLLHGSVGYQQVEVNAQGRIIRVLDRTPPVPGKNIYLTLDVSLQNLAVDALGDKRGAIVAIDPRDGSILALVSTPGYDPNLFVNGIDSFSYRKILNSKDTPLLNRALQGKYPPGSTIKPFIGFAALNYGLRTPYEETFCQGWFSIPGRSHRYRDWKKYGHGYVNLDNAIAQSCDVYFYTLAFEMGIDRLYPALQQFGFGKKTGIDIGGEDAGLLPSREWKRRVFGQIWFPGETVIMGIGQGSISVTPIQLATATAAMANRGKTIIPHLLAEVRDPVTGETVRHVGSRGRQAITAAQDTYWDEIITAMVDVVHGAHGTARRSGLGAAYRFAGKTGTAQIVGMPQDEEEQIEDLPEELLDHALFIAFAPVEAPRIAVAIIVENGGHGSRSAAPIARRLFDHYFNEKPPQQG
ncbi:MAG: penicillin-binding protein 2 [Gammaproteobacteria bacterium]